MNLVRFTAALAAASLFPAASSEATDLLSPGMPDGYETVVQSPVIDWSGAHFGAFAGYAFGESDVYLPGTNTLLETVDVSGGLVGGLIGFDWQRDRWVFGVEAEIAGSGVDGSGPVTVLGPGASTDVNWMATVRGRLGWTQGRWLLFGTAGAAFYEMNLEPLSGTDTNVHRGWTAGLGFEYAVSPSLSIGAEYRYVDLGRRHYNPSPDLKLQRILVTTRLRLPVVGDLFRRAERPDRELLVTVTPRLVPPAEN